MLETNCVFEYYDIVEREYEWAVICYAGGEPLMGGILFYLSIKLIYQMCSDR